MFTDFTTAYVQASMDERIRQAEHARATKVLRRHAHAARTARKAEALAAAPVATTHRHPWLWSLTHVRHA